MVRLYFSSLFYNSEFFYSFSIRFSEKKSYFPIEDFSNIYFPFYQLIPGYAVSAKMIRTCTVNNWTKNLHIYHI